MAASTDPFGIDLSALDNVSGAGSSPTPAVSVPIPAEPLSAPVASEPGQSSSSLGSVADELHSMEPPSATGHTAAPDSPNAQDQIHTGYGTVDAPRDGALSSTTVTADGVDLTANDLNGDGVVESVDVELADGNRIVYADTDLDGSFDTVRYETTDFRTYQVESDTDGDGQIDTVITFDEDYTPTVSIDTDGDGLADESYTSENGVVDPA
ncbi:hypothetical protein ACWDTG_26155 [Rhodococcus zopfii]|uniref:hypothetical protein n=1 Tax=Rhodococcus zopfii TaxID=43772 RepID=UPI0011113B8F|nr:hypothetical protein [Rhodococcus zopfii]